MKIIITELDKNQTKIENFSEKDLIVVSRSGLHPTEKNLLNQRIKDTDLDSSLFINNRTGVMPIYLAKTYPEAEISILNIDYHYYKQVEQNLAVNSANVNNLCTSNFDNLKKLSQVFLQIDSSTYSKEFYLDIFVKHYNLLKKRGKYFISSDKRVKWFEDFLRLHNISYTLETFNKSEYIIILRKAFDLSNNVNFDDTYELNLPNKAQLKFFSVPGVFSHHRIDEGGLALIDLVEASAEDIIIDMGCGVGTVGVALAKFYSPAQVIFVDSNIRAIDCAKINSEMNQIENCTYLLSDEGLNNGKASIFVGNPPYFSNYRIADLFIDNAKDCLIKGGKAYIVAKNIKHIHMAMLKVFGNATITPRRGYSVITSIKN